MEPYDYLPGKYSLHGFHGKCCCHDFMYTIAKNRVDHIHGYTYRNLLETLMNLDPGRHTIRVF